jgi:serine/threonine protein kinase
MGADNSEQATHSSRFRVQTELVDAALIAGRYRLLRRLGAGSSGEVFVARDESTGLQVALKRQLPKSGRKASPVNLMREYHALSGLRHPKIIEVYDYGVEGTVPFYTMELLDGHDLSELSPLPFREACGYLRDVASSLALLHDRRLLHRDVSPRNVRLMRDGRCKLIDFGAMIPFGTPPNIVGTATCIAPEALQGGTLDQTSDLYSLGTVAYFALTGCHAFPARELGTLPALWRQRVPVMHGHGEIPDALVELVMSLLSLDPAQRPSSAAEVIDRLSAIAELPQEDSLAIGRGYLASTPLLGRTRERALLSHAMSETKKGKGCALWVIGEAGSGKTRMLAEASLLGQTSGLVVMRATLREQRGLSSSLAHDVVMGLMKVAPREALKALSDRPLIKAIVYDEPVASDRAELLHQVEAFVSEIASQQPLLVTFDDVHHGSDLDSALIAALSHRASSASLCVVGSERSQKRAAWRARISDLVRPLSLRPLDRTQVALLSSALFGDVPNLAPVSDFLYRNAQGNPKVTLELAERLLARGTLRYVAGSWVLPDQISEPMPHDMAQTLMLRLEDVAADARSLVEVLCVRRRGASAEQLIDLAKPLATEQVLHSLEELVRAGVIESAGYEYAFVQEALRAELARTLTTDRSHELHRRWAEYLLARNPTQDERLEAGWHLVHTPEDLRGAELLVDVAPRLVEQRQSMATAIPAVERALEVYERHGKSLSTRLRLRALLVLSSYLYDYRLTHRYADEIFDLLYPFTGLREAEWNARWFGKRAGFVIGVCWAALRWWFRPAATRGPHVFAALKYYAMSAMGLIGLRALAVDNTESVLERMRGFQDAPHPMLALTYEMARAIHLHGLGRPADAHHAIDRAWSQLEGKRPWQVTAHDHLDLTIGLLLLQGINECSRERSRALECADKLERIDTQLAIASSYRIRMMYYLVRGDAAQAHNFRRLLELKAVETGSLWQVQWMAVPLEGMAAATWHDLVGLRRALERLDQIVLEAPALSRMREATLVPYYFIRGEYENAATTGDEYIRKFPPKTCIGWPATYAMTALAHAHLGRPARALEICELALSHVDAEDREYFVFYGVLDAAYATALALTGNAAKSAEVFRERIERMRNAGEHLRALVMHHYRIRLARLTGDQVSLQEALADMQHEAVLSRNPAAVALAQRLSEERSAYSEHPFEIDPWLEVTEPSTPERIG